LFGRRRPRAYISPVEYIGETAALATALLWAFTSLFFAEAGKLLGSFRVNNIRLLVAVVIYCLVLVLTTGRLWPAELNQQQFLWLAASGMVGLVMGDGCGFKALVMIGPRLTTLLYAAAPIIATVISWIFLDEKLGTWSVIGIVVTITGITWVVLERTYGGNSDGPADRNHPDAGSRLKGVFLGLGAAGGQAIGLVMAKQAMAYSGGTVEPLEASFVRMSCALVLIWLIAAGRRQLPSTLAAMKNLKGLGFTSAGAVVGPFLGVWMSLVAITYIATGIAATLNAMTPVLIIPLVILYYKEKVSARALIGAVVAVGGVAIIYLS